jgi:hypothetical protein
MTTKGSPGKSAVDADFQWTTGEDGRIQHQALIDVGGYSEVHRVRSVFCIMLRSRCFVTKPVRYQNSADVS